VGGAEHLHLETLDQDARSKGVVPQAGVAQLVHLTRALRIEQPPNAKGALQLEVRPVVERVAERCRNGRRPGFELLPRARVAGAAALGDAGGPHRAPLVVVTVQPELGDAGELVILRELGGGQVAVIVDDRQLPGDVVVEPPGGLAVQQKVLVEEARRRHRRTRPLASPRASRSTSSICTWLKSPGMVCFSALAATASSSASSGGLPFKLA